jgi:hypothetical protein
LHFLYAEPLEKEISSERIQIVLYRSTSISELLFQTF